MRAIAYLIAISVILLVPHAQGGPYMGGYPNNSLAYANYVFANNDFAGSTTISTTVGHVLSTAGFTSSSDANPNGWIYQLSTNLWCCTYRIIGQGETHYQGPKVWICWDDNPDTCPDMVANSDINYVCGEIFWGAGRSTVNFFWRAFYKDGTMPTFLISHTKDSGDTSQWFSAGTGFASGCTRKVKFLQFGVESASQTSGWQIKQFSMGYNNNFGNTISLDNIDSYSTVTDAGAADSSWITYWSGSICGPWNFGAVGTANYDAKAHSKCIDGSLPNGQVQWFPGTPPLAAGTKLWVCA